jgi:CRISPR-associated protein Cas1
MTETPLGIIVEISEGGRHLSKDRGFLVVSSGGDEAGRIPLDDIAAVLLSSHGTTVSVALLAELCERGVPTSIGGRSHAPVGLAWPVDGHHAQQRRMEAQLANTGRLAKPLWAGIVAAKIRAQGRALASIGARHGAFERLAARVRSGDEGNLEAQAARRYWPLLMGDDFRRDHAGTGANTMLNYGYAILRAHVARAIVAAGLHPGLGIFHRHPRNAMPLADDLMEPFRPTIDLEVCRVIRDGGVELTSAVKRMLAATMMQERRTARGHTPLSTCVLRLAQAIAQSYLSRSVDLEAASWEHSGATHPFVDDATDGEA